MQVDVAIVGAGAAGLFCAARAGQRGRRVLVLDHAPKVAEKIRISGGGRCNFTNREGHLPERYHSANPAFCRSALARYTPQDFIGLVQRHRIAWHEKHRGQLFCDGSSHEIIELLLRECETGRVERWQPCRALGLEPALGAAAPSWRLATERGDVAASRVVIATGGMSVPRMGATDYGLRVAERLGHELVEPRPALVPLRFDAAEWTPFSTLSGVALEVEIAAGPQASAESVAQAVRRRGARPGARFVEDLLFTHRGLSGPAILQASGYWRAGESIDIAVAPGVAWEATLLAGKAQSRRLLQNELAQWLPQRLAQAWLAQPGMPPNRPLAEIGDRALRDLARSLAAWHLHPTGTEGWGKAEVMAGGVDTREVDSRTMESRRAPGLHFVGEVLDVTGWLGGYNFQWAWASAAACAEAL